VSVPVPRAPRQAPSPPRLSVAPEAPRVLDAHVGALCGWGRQAVPGYEVRDESLETITQGAVLSRGLGRSYGDSALPPPGQRAVVGTVLADRFLSFDPETGLLRGEAGLSLDTIIRRLFPRGWFPPVTPGTKFVTLGGCVASDVHGKNHHVDGTFGAYVRSLRMRVADGRILECSPENHRDLFWATVGGMGLTGHILEVEFQMRRVPSPWIWQRSERVPSIDAFIERLSAAAETWPMTMGWIDCISRGRNLGRGLLMCGRWASPGEAPPKFPRPKKRPSMPFVLPQWVLNRLSMRAFNALYYWKHLPRVKEGIVHPEAFFWPLDAIGEWNKMYGPRGFTQYQCVLPREAGRGAARRFLELLTGRGGASFLCVIKDCGAEGEGMLSFPTPGVSIALDIPVRDDTQALVDALNELVIAEGGRMYLTKDLFTRREHFARMYPRLAEFEDVRRRWDPHGRLRSAQSVRLLGDAPAQPGIIPPP
jgi:decaprenylphospho-beta-D-ribofuranose 2-oxidase